MISSTGTTTNPGISPSKKANSGSSGSGNLATPFDTELKAVSQQCKQLVVALKLWREHRLPEEQVSEIYTRLVTHLYALLDVLQSQKQHSTVEAADKWAEIVGGLEKIPDPLRVALETLLLSQPPHPSSDVSAVDEQQQQQVLRLVDQNVEEVKRVVVCLLQQLNQCKQAYLGNHAAPPTSAISSDKPVSEPAPTVPTALPSTPSAPAILQDSAAPPPPLLHRTLFLQYQQQTKRIRYHGPPLTVLSLRALFPQHFAALPDTMDAEMYMRDDTHGVFFECQDSDLMEMQDGVQFQLRVGNGTSGEDSIPVLGALQQLTGQLEELKTEMQRIASTRAPLAVLTTPSSSSRQPSPIRQGPPPPPLPSRQNAVAGPLADEGELAVNLPALVQERRRDVRELRREVGVLRQVVVASRQTMAQRFQFFRQQTEAIRAQFQNGTDGRSSESALSADASNEGLQAKRRMMELGKEKLRVDSEALRDHFDTLTAEMESLKTDVVQRGSYPTPQHLERLQLQLQHLIQQLQSTDDYVLEVKPMWKRVWETQLQAIVEEQQFLKTVQQQLDHWHDGYPLLQQTLEQVQTFLRVRAETKSKRTFEPKPRDEYHQGLPTVIQEMKTLDPHDDRASSRRLHAVEQGQRVRKLDLSQRQKSENPLTTELGTFVAQQKLKRTGGVEEVERMRQQREQDVLEELLNQMA